MYTIRRLSKRFRIFLLAAAVLLLLLVLIDVTGFGRDALSVAVPLSSDSDMARAEFLSAYGWEVSSVPEEVCEVTIPGIFDGVYNTYNDLQRSQGFDLLDYRGKNRQTVHLYHS